MAEADKKRKADDAPVQMRDREGRLMYRCTADCMFGNEFFARGQEIAFPEDRAVGHSCIVPIYADSIKKSDEPARKLYDPNAEALKKHDIESARAGIIQR